MLKTLKNYQILDLMDGFKKIGEQQIKSNKKFSYALILNDEAIQPYVKAMQTVATPGDSYMEYEQKRNDIIVKYAKVDGAGNIQLNEQRGVVFKDDVDIDVVGNELDELNKEYEDILEERDNDIKEYNELITKDVEVNLEVVDIDDVPEDVGEDIFLMKMLIPMID